jgi:23S rRNA pseudouridine2605 synthase
MEVRIQKLIAQAGICSRRKAEEMIEGGHVRVNGHVAHLGQSADPEKDEVLVQGQRISADRKAYLMLNKPVGYITTASDPWGRKGVLELLYGVPRVFPVGRLDRDAKGLLLLTNDGDFANRIMHPRYMVKKTYEVTLDRKISSEDIRTINEGVVLDRRRIQAHVVRLSTKRVRITVHTGINKEIKRIFRKVGYWVRGLTRTEIGGVVLNVKEGKFRHLVQSEIKKLLGQSGSSGR